MIVVLGFWLIVAPFILSYTNLGGPAVNHIIVGLLVGGTALTVTMQNLTPTQRRGRKHA